MASAFLNYAHETDFVTANHTSYKIKARPPNLVVQGLKRVAIKAT
jgi:hypothetical protein